MIYYVLFFSIIRKWGLHYVSNYQASYYPYYGFLRLIISDFSHRSSVTSMGIDYNIEQFCILYCYYSVIDGTGNVDIIDNIVIATRCYLLRRCRSWWATLITSSTRSRPSAAPTAGSSSPVDRSLYTIQNTADILAKRVNHQLRVNRPDSCTIACMIWNECEQHRSTHEIKKSKNGAFFSSEMLNHCKVMCL